MIVILILVKNRRNLRKLPVPVGINIADLRIIIDLQIISIGAGNFLYLIGKKLRIAVIGEEKLYRSVRISVEIIIDFRIQIKLQTFIAQTPGQFLTAYR